MTSFGAMTWNVENLFRRGPEAEEAERERYQQKLGLLAEVVGRLDPDVLALQEVGGEDKLADLQEVLDGDYPHRAVSRFHDGRGIRFAFLSKRSVEEQEDIVEFPEGPALDVHYLTASGDTVPIDRMGRGALRLRVTKDGLTVGLITCHLKSTLHVGARTCIPGARPREARGRSLRR